MTGENEPPPKVLFLLDTVFFFEPPPADGVGELANVSACFHQHAMLGEIQEK